MFPLALKNSIIFSLIILIIHILLKNTKPAIQAASPKLAIVDVDVDAEEHFKPACVPEEEDQSHRISDTISMIVADTMKPIPVEAEDDVISDLDKLFMNSSTSKIAPPTKSTLLAKDAVKKTDKLDEVFEHVFKTKPEETGTDSVNVNNSHFVVNKFDNEKGLNGGSIFGNLVGYDSSSMSFSEYAPY
jgi:hypothetical protein